MFKKLLRGKYKYIIYITIVLLLMFIVYFVSGIVKNTRLSMTGYVPTGHYPSYPNIDFSELSAEYMAKIKRGEYIVKAGDCIACHTNPSDIKQPYSGGLPIQTPFGIIYSPNITPDKETGIGKWSDKDFITAMHDGISPSGYFYYPAFPYIYFNKITKDDLLAVKAYLDKIPAIKKENKKPQMIFPFNIRFVQLGWRILFFYPERTGFYQFNDNQSKAWNTGAYIVEGAGHCAMCHTPSYYILNKNISMGAPIHKYNLTGQVIEGYLAPNISKSNLGAIPSEQIVEVFTKYRMLGGGRVQGPMKEAVHDSLAHLSKGDLLGVAEYLKSVDSEIPSDTHTSRSATGASVYNNYCAGCHNSGIGGAPRFGDKTKWQTLSRSGLEKLYRVAYHGGGNMPSRGTCITCTDQELRDAVDYMVAASTDEKAYDVRSTRDKMSGQENYQHNCAGCHNNPNANATQMNDKAAWQAIEKKGFLATYKRILNKKHHPENAGCRDCSDSQILSALKYMMQKGTGNSYKLW